MLEKIDDTKGLIRSCKSNAKWYNGQKNKDTTQKTQDWATSTPQKKGMNQGAPEEVAVQYCYISKILQGKITIVPQGVQITWSEKISRPSKPSSHDL